MPSTIVISMSDYGRGEYGTFTVLNFRRSDSACAKCSRRSSPGIPSVSMVWCGVVWCAECSEQRGCFRNVASRISEGIGAQALKRRLSSPSVDEMEAKRRRSRPYANVDPMVRW